MLIKYATREDVNPPKPPTRGHIPTLRASGQLGRRDLLYIGRKFTRGVYNFPASPWQNPFTTRVHGRARALELYGQYIRSRPRLLERLPELEGKVLGCWCKPGERCHADVLIELYGQRVLGGAA